MIEKKEYVVCGSEVLVINCYYSYKNCRFNEDGHDIPNIIDKNEKFD